jgi:hypothetical protein
LYCGWSDTGTASSSSRVRSSTRRIFPEIVLGSSENSILPTRRKGARFSRACLRMANAVSRVGSKPGGRAMYALGTAARTGSGTGTTVASVTAGCSMCTLSSSNGLIL